MGAPRTYQLFIEVARGLEVLQVGRLGRFDFPAGLYVYTGSARRALEARIRRHVEGAARKHWHIDYLLAVPGVRVVRVLYHDQPECAVNAATPGSVVVPRFGASDCRAGCGSHLKRLPG
ncbi:MAG: GIY-YIG nuclease family protein [Betaproteobacteria bacterium]|nr:GIY-YIG nuclease family protein [Betaproteobacteria bacterium]